MKPDATPTERFTGWYVKAVEKLKELPDGDGAFAALMIGLPLYERYITAKLKLAGDVGSGVSCNNKQSRVYEAMNEDLNLTDGQRRVFWDTVRVGFTHQGTSKSGPTGFLVNTGPGFGPVPSFKTIKGIECVCIDPWAFVEMVLSRFLEDPRLITASESFPLLEVYRLSENDRPTD